MSTAKSMIIKLEENNILDYVVIGGGKKNIISIPGLSDGLDTVKGKHILLSHYFRRFKKHYTIYVFSRRRNLPEPWSTEDMAKNLITACKELKITDPHIIGTSMGGMIAQHIAINYPDFFDKMVLAITSSKTNTTIQNVVSSWINWIKKDEIKEFREDLLLKTYTEEYLHKTRFFAPLIKISIRIKDKERFLKQADACLKHNAHDSLSKIHNSVLIIGGNSDKIVGPKSSDEIHAAIPGSQLKLFEDIGHSLCEERKKEFDDAVLHFFQYN